MNLTWLVESTFLDNALLISILAIALVVSIAACTVARIWRHRAGVAHGVLWSGMALLILSPLIGVAVPKAVEFEMASSVLLPHSSLAIENSTRNVNESLPKTTDATSARTIDPKQKPPSEKTVVETMASDSIADSFVEQSASAKPTEVAATAPSVSIRAVLFYCWFAVSGLLLIRLAFQFISMFVVFGNPLDCKNETLLAAFAAAKQRVPGTDGVRICCGKVATPVAMNFPARQVVVPVDFEMQMTHESARRILTHELAHVRRYDQIALLLQRLMTCFLWSFVPVHFLNRAINQTREDLCDNYVDQAESLEFCKDLLQLTLLPRATKPEIGLALVPGLFSRRNLEHRVGGILSDSRIFEKQTKLHFLALSFTGLIVSATAIASIGIVHDGANKYVTNFESKPGATCDFKPLFRSIRLSDDSPSNLEVKISQNENATAQTIQFGEIRYGSAASDRLSLVLVRQNSKDITKNNLRLYLDRNRDRVVEDEEMIERSVVDGKALWRCQIDCLIQNSDDKNRNVKLQREVAFRSGALDDRIGFATVGFMEGTVNIDGSKKQVRRMDADGNGLFTDPSDRIWIDLNQNDEWEIDEQFKLKPIMLVGESRFRVRMDSQSATFRMLPVNDTGTLQLNLPLDDPTAKIERLQVTFSGNGGTGFTINGLEPITVPTGEYEITNVAIVVSKSETATSRSFVFTQRGQLARAGRKISIGKDQNVQLDTIGKLRLIANAGSQVQPNGTLVVGLGLYTIDGLAVTYSDTGVRAGKIHGNQENEVVTRIVNQEKEVIGGVTSGFY